MKHSIRSSWTTYILSLQERICTALEKEDGKARFQTDEWKRAGGGGGKTRVIANGDFIEKGGVNTSIVEGEVTDKMRKHLNIDGDRWFACGLSLIIHPINPFVPTVHANYRYFELYDKEDKVINQWFGGGSDLTPFYLFEEDARHFHQTLKKTCDSYDDEFYPAFKKWCDDYFVNSHRDNEARGIGGIFYDHLQPNKNHDIAALMAFSQANGDAFIPAYLPLVQRRKNMTYTENNKKWQEIRRGRYVEFNLVHDRGTLFGLKTNGRTESILMSLPPTVQFIYDYQPKKGSEEWKLLEVCKHPIDWID